MSNAEWERRVSLEFNQMRRFLGVPRDLYPRVTDLTVAQLWALVLAVLALIGYLWPVAVPFIVVSFLIRLVWVIVA